MSMTLALLFVASIVCDVAGQLCFKIGAERLPDFHGPDRAAFYSGLLKDWWLACGHRDVCGRAGDLAQDPVRGADLDRFPARQRELPRRRPRQPFRPGRSRHAHAVDGCRARHLRRRAGRVRCLIGPPPTAAWTKNNNKRRSKTRHEQHDRDRGPEHVLPRGQNRLPADPWPRRHAGRDALRRQRSRQGRLHRLLLPARRPLRHARAVA